MSEATAAAPETAAPEAPAPSAEPATPPAATPEAPKEQTPDPLKMHERFRAFSRKEAQFRQERQQFEASKSELEARAAKAEEFETLLTKAKENPLIVLDKMGLSFDELAQAVLASPKDSPELAAVKKELKTEIDALRAKDEERERAALEQQQQWVDQQITLYKKDLDTYLETNPERYELISVRDAKNDVYSLVENWFKETGEILTPEQAADQVEKQLEDELELLAKTKKLSAKLSQPSAVTTAAPSSTEPVKEIPKQDVQESRRPSPTIRSVVSSGVKQVVKAPTDTDRFKRAVDQLKFVRD